MYRFGAVEVDPRAREIRRDGRAEHLEPQAFDLLVHLIERRDEVVAKHDLLDGVWGHRFVSEAALTTRIKEIRKAVGDDGITQHTIRNIRGRGYRFVAELTELPGRSQPGAPVPDAIIGRGAELADVIARLERAPVVTIVGPGGVGKSTLAHAALRALAGTAADGSCVVELAPLDSADRVVPAIAGRLDVVLEADRPDRALASIARLDAVIVLDNCEHVVDAVAEAVARMVGTPGARIRVIATSQLRLGVSGEEVLGLGPMPPEDAMALFDRRARAVRPAWDLDAVDGERRSALLEQLDLLPLMIEMAAARLSSMTFDDLETAIGETRRLVQMSHRTPTQRHRTLGSLVEWSADLLPPEHRQGFVEFGVFAGAVTAQDATLVLGPAAPDLVVELAERSLLAVDLSGGTARYRMLDTVRGVARRWLADHASAPDVHRRHADAMVAAIVDVDHRLRSTDEPAARRRLDTLVAEVRQAHRWAREHDVATVDRLNLALHLAGYGRLWNEPAVWAAEQLNSAADPTQGPPAALLLVAGAAAHEGRLDVARTMCEEIIATTDEPRRRASAIEVLADVAIYSGQLDECAAYADALRSLGEALGDQHWIAMGTINVSLACTFGGEPDDGLRVLGEVEAGRLGASDRAWVAYATGEARAALGDGEGAIAALREAIDLAGSVGNPFPLSVARSSLAAEQARRGARRDAYESYDACLRDAARHGNLVHAVTTIRNLVNLLDADGDRRSAAVLGLATSNDGVRPSYGAESAELTAVLAEIESATWPDRWEAWVAESAHLDLDGTLRRAIAIVESHLATPN